MSQNNIWINSKKHLNKTKSTEWKVKSTFYIFEKLRFFKKGIEAIKSGPGGRFVVTGIELEFIFGDTNNKLFNKKVETAWK